MSRRYDQGSTSQSRQLASSEVKRALTAPASSLPTKSQFLRPTASRRSASSLMLLWMGRRPSSRKLREADALVARVADAVRDRRVVEHRRRFGVAPREEGIDDVAGALVADLLFFLRGESARVRSMRKSAPMKPSAALARSGSESSALKKYRLACAQQLTSTRSPLR